jgi:hypothetical protein
MRKEVVMLEEPMLTCPVCAAPREFEQPPCPDGHGADCPDLVCVECGIVLVVRPYAPDTTDRRHAA